MEADEDHEPQVPSAGLLSRLTYNTGTFILGVGGILIGLFALIVAIGFGIYAINNPEPVGTAIRSLGGITPEPTPTAYPTNTPWPTHTLQPTIVVTEVIVVTATPQPATATPQPTATPLASILFEDDFDDGLDPAWEDISGSYDVVDGRLTTGTNLTVLVSEPSWSDYTVKLETERGGYAFINSAIYVRARDLDNMVAFRWGWGIQGRGGSAGASWFVRQDGNWKELTNSYKSIGRLDSIRTILIRVQNSQFKAYIDGELIGSFISSDYPAGGVGLELADGFLIDNFEVTSIDS